MGLLARCVRRRVNDAIVVLALKCLSLLLRYPSGLPSLSRHAPRLAKSVLRLLTMAGGPANSRDEVRGRWGWGLGVGVGVREGGRTCWVVGEQTTRQGWTENVSGLPTLESLWWVSLCAGRLQRD